MRANPHLTQHDLIPRAATAHGRICRDNILRRRRRRTSLSMLSKVERHLLDCDTKLWGRYKGRRPMYSLESQNVAHNNDSARQGALDAGARRRRGSRSEQTHAWCLAGSGLGATVCALAESGRRSSRRKHRLDVTCLCSVISGGVGIRVGRHLARLSAATPALYKLSLYCRRRGVLGRLSDICPVLAWQRVRELLRLCP